jgi:hypothetical protein
MVAWEITDAIAIGSQGMLTKARSLNRVQLGGACMNVLIAYESSGTVREAFRKLGHMTHGHATYNPPTMAASFI